MGFLSPLTDLVFGKPPAPAPAPAPAPFPYSHDFKVANFINRGCWSRTNNIPYIDTGDFSVRPPADFLGGIDVPITQKYSSDIQYIEEQLGNINSRSYDTIGFYRNSQNLPTMRLAKKDSVFNGVTLNYNKLGSVGISRCGSYDRATQDAFLIYEVPTVIGTVRPPSLPPPPPPSTGIIQYQPIAMSSTV